MTNTAVKTYAKSANEPSGVPLAQYPELLKSEHVMELLGVSHTHAWRLMKSLPVINLGLAGKEYLRVRKDDFIAKFWAPTAAVPDVKATIDAGDATHEDIQSTKPRRGRPRTSW
jgi:hypothetical protein